jgi:hypothetical protein
MSVRFLVRVGVAIRVEVAWKSDRERSATGARETEVGPKAGSSLASGDFDAAGHATREREEKGPRFRARAWS